MPTILDATASLSPHRIVEDTYEVDASDINDTQYRQMIDRARQLVSQTLMGGSHGITISTMAHDKWRERLLGPAIIGKVAAGTYRYLYLREEHGRWKIWKFELDE